MRPVSLLSAVVILLCPITFTTVRPQQRSVIQSRFATLDQVKLDYLIAGKGDPVILLHGYAQTSRMWRPLIVDLAKGHTVIAPDCGIRTFSLALRLDRLKQPPA